MLSNLFQFLASVFVITFEMNHEIFNLFKSAKMTMMGQSSPNTDFFFLKNFSEDVYLEKSKSRKMIHQRYLNNISFLS